MTNIALIVAGGVGSRMQQEIPKQFLTVEDRPVIIYTLEKFQNHPEIDVIAVVCLQGWENFLQAYANQFNITKLKHIFPGGENRQSSIENGIFELEKIYSPDDILLTHDANRPLVSAEIISDCLATVKKFGSACTVTPCVEAMLLTEDEVTTSAQYPRDKIKHGQTPRGFFLGKACEVHRWAAGGGA